MKMPWAPNDRNMLLGIYHPVSAGLGRTVAFQEVGRSYSVDHLVGEYEDLKVHALADPQRVLLGARCRSRSAVRNSAMRQWPVGVTTQLVGRPTDDTWPISRQ